ncbi:glycosyltransferase, partial [Klebsiella pneumoniae]
GCALVSTAYNGVLEYAVNAENALLSPVRDSKALAENIIKLIENDPYRQSLAKKASESISERSWDKTIQKLETVLA